MASRLASVLFALVIGVLSLSAHAELRVVASVPDVADMARQIGGDRISVETIASGSQDPHKVPMKPSFVTKLHRADALVVQGLQLEDAYLPGLLEVARNPKILPGAPAYIDASIYVEPLEVPASLSRAQGELHALGNPHFNLDPEQGRRMARAIAEGLMRVDPPGTATYRAGLERFLARLDAKIAEWSALAAPLRGVRVVSYHRDLVYLANRYGFELIGTIETRPGVPATPRHLEELVELMKQENAQLVIREVSYELPLARTVAERAGASLATVSVLTGGLPGGETYVEFVETNLRALLSALVAAGDGD